MKKKRFVFCLIGLPGSGKTEIIKSITRKYSLIHRIVTSTTRSPRLGELDGVDYYFVNHDDFSEEKYIQISHMGKEIYGTKEEEIRDINIVALTMDGIEQYKSCENINLIICYLDCDISKCRARMIGRRDEASRIEEKLKSDIDWLSKIKDSSVIKIVSHDNDIEGDAERLYNEITKIVDNI